MENPYIKKNQTNENSGIFSTTNFDSNQFLKGLLIGVAATYLLTNEKAQNAIFKAVAKSGELFQASIEEMKERFEDAKAELEANKA